MEENYFYEELDHRPTPAELHARYEAGWRMVSIDRESSTKFHIWYERVSSNQLLKAIPPFGSPPPPVIPE